MANTKTQKPLTMSKTKSENMVEWFVTKAHWKILSEQLGKKKTAIFSYKNQIKKIADEEDAFNALAEVFTVKELNALIALFNDTIKHPEKYEKPKKKQQVDLESQEKVVNKHMKDMNMNNTYYSKDKNNEKS